MNRKKRIEHALKKGKRKTSRGRHPISPKFYQKFWHNPRQKKRIKDSSTIEHPVDLSNLSTKFQHNSKQKKKDQRFSKELKEKNRARLRKK